MANLEDLFVENGHTKMAAERPDSPPHIAIIGAGASGTLAAVQLIRNARQPLCITIIEPNERLGRGIAYSTLSSAHLLNVPAGNMSALPNEPRHFLNWLHRYKNPDASDYSFVPRITYGEYVEQLLKDATPHDGFPVPVRHIRGRAVRLTPVESGFDVSLESDSLVRAHSIVLALGNGPAANPFATSSDAEIIPAWPSIDLAHLSNDAPVLLAGSGLTAIDVCLSLAEIGHAGPIYIVSRRGLLPRVHPDAPASTRPNAFKPKSPLTARELVREVRESAARALSDHRSWHSVTDALRPHLDEIWRALSTNEKRRFLRHVRPYWDVHRHRMPAQVHHKIEMMRLSGQLRVLSGRLIDATAEARGEINVRMLAGHPQVPVSIRVAKIINCAGPQNDPRMSPDRLVRQLVEDRIGRPDPLYMGLETAPNGALISGSGSAWNNLFAIGPMRKGTLWETTSIPEIRSQASLLAHNLISLFPNRVST